MWIKHITKKKKSFIESQKSNMKSCIKLEQVHIFRFWYKSASKRDPLQSSPQEVSSSFASSNCSSIVPIPSAELKIHNLTKPSYHLVLINLTGLYSFWLNGLYCWIGGLSGIATPFAEFDICNQKKKWWHDWGLSLDCSSLEVLHLYFLLKYIAERCFDFLRPLFSAISGVWSAQFQPISFKFREAFGLTSFQNNVLKADFRSNFWIEFEFFPIEVGLSIIWNGFVWCDGRFAFPR